MVTTTAVRLRMTTSITELARAIDIIARRCPRGLSALAGDVPQPSRDELIAAATWTPAAEVQIPASASGGEHVTSAVQQIMTLTGPIEAVGWEKIVAAVREVRDLYPLQWAAYRLHVIHVSTGDQWRADGGTLKSIAEKCGISVQTVVRWRHIMPRRIAKVALK